jgi:hypothetical protein
MVHALHSVKKILKSGGYLLDVHDLPVPHLIEVEQGNCLVKVGWLLEKRDFIDERSGFNALVQVVDEGLFTLEDEQDFTFNIYIDRLDDFYKWLADFWESAFLPERTLHKIEELMAKGGRSARIVVKTPTRMTKLRVV